MATYSFYSDPSHGWLRVSKRDIDKVGLNASSFSTFSFLDDKFFYLEEDLDLKIFFNAFHRMFMKEPSIRLMPQSSRTSKIRAKMWNRMGETDYATLRENASMG